MAVEEERTNRSRLGLPAVIRACLFDLDGVLTRTARVHRQAWKETFDEYLGMRARATGDPFVPFDAVHDYAEYVDGKPRSDGIRSFLLSRGIRLAEGNAADAPSAETVAGLGARKNERFLALLHGQGVATYEGSIRFVIAAREAALRTAVVSSSRNCREVIRSAGIEHLFDAVVDGVVARDQHLAGKPSPDTYVAAARAVAVAPSQCAVFEDALAGVEAGRAGHFGWVVGVDRVGQAGALREHGADVVVSDLAELLVSP